MRPPVSLSTALLSLALLTSAVQAADANTDWQSILALDAGPQARPTTQQEAKAISLGHLGAQEKALRAYLKSYPGDEHSFEANLRLARLLQLRAGLENTEAPRKEAKRLLDDLSRTATSEQRPEVDFAQIAYRMRTLRRESAADREQLLLVTRRFQAEHPQDRRLARLLVEIGNLFDAEPETKRGLLLSALAMSPEEDLKRRIADDLRRVEMLGKPVPLRFSTVSGKAVDVAESRGKVVLVIFFADFSPPSMEAVTKLQQVVHDLPSDKVQVLGVSLDNKPEELTAAISRQSIAWPVGFDGKGWGSPLVREFGINTLPTVWILDQAGLLRALNGLDSTKDQVLKLLQHPVNSAP